MFTPCWWWKGIHPHVHTLLVVERDTSSYSHPAGGEKGYTLVFTPCWWWKGIHSRVYIVDCGQGYSLTPTPLVVDRDTNFMSFLLVMERGNGIHPHV